MKRQLTCHGAATRKGLKTRSSHADFRYLQPERFTVVNRKVH
jgi:hypothetical protein